MSAKVTVTGIIAEPRPGWGAGKELTELRICGTFWDKENNTEVGAPLWIGATFWDRAAHQVRALMKGDRVTVEGTLIIEEYEGRNGPRQSLTLKYPRFLGVVPKVENGPAPRVQHNAPAGGSTTDQWAAPQTFDDTPPF